MKIWFDKDKTNFKKFTSEQFLLLPLFRDEVINKDNDFKYNNQWKESIGKLVSFTSKEDCDVFLFPEKLNEKINEYIIESKKYNKKIIAFFNDDYDKPSCLDNNVILYRTSLFKSKQKNNEYAMPAWSQDFTDVIPFKPRVKKDIPTVSFCGFFSDPIRSKSIEILNKNKNIETNFIIREAFWGGNPHNTSIRNEYINNIMNSDLVLCTRGAGNFSYRLYEALSCGRIPIFIDTDCALPCEDKINWKDLCIFIEDINNLNTHINNFWQNITPSEYTDRQIHARQAYEEFLSPNGFAKYVSYNI